jgi:NAD(P)-dependent dehydrogenase (short-subunit alcohol dehydrogenase family)
MSDNHPVDRPLRRYAIITGSSRGLGFSLAQQFAKKNIVPILLGRCHETLVKAQTAIHQNTQINPILFASDLTLASSPAHLVQFLTQHQITPDIIVHNLGGGVTGDQKNPPVAVLRSSLRLNLEVAIEINNLLYEKMCVQKSRVLHIGSTASLHYDAPPSYVIAKTALIAYVKNAARSWARDGVTISALLPGMLDHDGSFIDRLRTTDEARYQHYLAQMPYGRFITSDEVAQFAVSLCLDSIMLNGSVIVMDGGRD